jgi:RNA binding exosome subunit
MGIRHTPEGDTITHIMVDETSSQQGRITAYRGFYGENLGIIDIGLQPRDVY